MKHICIVGMGRVGLTLALILASAGFKVYGIDRDKNAVASLNKGKPHFYEKGLDALLKKHLNNNLVVAQRMEGERQDAYIICVGTPVDRETKKVILEPLIQATSEVAEQLTKDSIVILRSTVPVGATRNIILPILRERQENFYLAYCPERTLEGRALMELGELPQIVGGLNEESVEKAVSIFSKVTATTVRVDSLEAAEMTKLIDNSYRDVNFALANEVALIADRLGVDAVELIKAANLGYPRNKVPVPGFVGGACLSKDPYILHESAASLGYETMLVKLARVVNESLPSHVAQKLAGQLSHLGKDIKSAKILVLGIAFKGQPDTDDVRDSPALSLIDYFKNEHGVNRIYGHDFIVPPHELQKAGVEPCSLEDGFKDADCVIFMNNHRSYYDLDIETLTALLNKPAVFIDVWHIFNPKDMREFDGVIYGGL